MYSNFSGQRESGPGLLGSGTMLLPMPLLAPEGCAAGGILRTGLAQEGASQFPVDTVQQEEAGHLLLLLPIRNCVKSLASRGQPPAVRKEARIFLALGP